MLYFTFAGHRNRGTMKVFVAHEDLSRVFDCSSVVDLRQKVKIFFGIAQVRFSYLLRGLGQMKQLENLTSNDKS